MKTTRLPALFVSHGGSWLTMQDTDPANRFMRAAGDELRALAPRAIVMVSAHYEGAPVQVLAHPQPRTLHDHPARDLYTLRYTAPGEPALARRIVGLLGEAGISAAEDLSHGYDHGAWIPLVLMFPEANVPVVMVSLSHDLDPARHVAIGRALGTLRDEGLLLIASGSLTHNLRDFFTRYSSAPDPEFVPDFSREFDRRASAMVTGEAGASPAEALAALLAEPLGRAAHPRSEHFLPLLVALGSSADGRGRQVHQGFQYGLSMAAFRFDH